MHQDQRNNPTRADLSDTTIIESDSQTTGVSGITGESQLVPNEEEMREPGIVSDGTP